jgi:ankyrin repeat protein
MIYKKIELGILDIYLIVIAMTVAKKLSMPDNQEEWPECTAQECYDSRTRLHDAAQWGCEIAHLLKAGYDPRATTVIGYTPMHFAAVHGNTNTVRELMKVAPETVSANSYHGTPYDLALKYGHDDVIDVMNGKKAIDQYQYTNANTNTNTNDDEGKERCRCCIIA